MPFAKRRRRRKKASELWLENDGRSNSTILCRTLSQGSMRYDLSSHSSSWNRIFPFICCLLALIATWMASDLIVSVVIKLDCSSCTSSPFLYIRLSFHLETVWSGYMFVCVCPCISRMCVCSVEYIMHASDLLVVRD